MDSKVWGTSVRTHGITRAPSPEEAAAHVYSPADKALVARNRSRLVVGGVAKVTTHLEPLIANTQADEPFRFLWLYLDAKNRRKHRPPAAPRFPSLHPNPNLEGNR